MKWKFGMADGWRRLHTKGTVLFAGAVGVIAPLAEVVRQTWAFVPDDLKEYLPHSLKQAISYTVLALAFIAIRYTTVKRVSRDEVQQ